MTELFSQCRGRKVCLVATVLTLASVPTTAISATAIGSMSVSLTIQSACSVDTVNALSFGTGNDLTVEIPVPTTIAITCTNTTPYAIELGAGAGSGATTSVRKMTSGSDTVEYSLYKDSGHASVWGTGSTDDVDATGNGAQQIYTVYGLVPVQSLPNPGTYTDTVAVTVTY